MNSGNRAFIQCKSCNFVMTWAEQKAGYGMLIRAGLSPATAKGSTPLCQRCARKLANSVKNLNVKG